MKTDEEVNLIEMINKYRDENGVNMLTELEVLLNEELIKYKSAIRKAVEVYNNELYVDNKFDENFLGLGDKSE